MAVLKSPKNVKKKAKWRFQFKLLHRHYYFYKDIKPDLKPKYRFRRLCLFFDIF